MRHSTAEQRLAIVLRALAGLLLVAALIYALGALVGPARDFFREPPFLASSAAKVTLIALACLYAAGDVRRRRSLVAIVIGAHVVSLAAMGSMLAFADTGRAADLGFAHPSIATVLWCAVALDGAIALVLVAFLLPVRGAAAPAPALERRMRALLIAFAILYALSAAAYELGPFLSSSEAFFRELPFVTNSVVKASLLAMLCAYAARDLALLTPVVAVHALAVVVQGLYLIFLDTDYTRPLLGGEVHMTDVLWGARGGARHVHVPDRGADSDRARRRHRCAARPRRPRRVEGPLRPEVLRTGGAAHVDRGRGRAGGRPAGAGPSGGDRRERRPAGARHPRAAPLDLPRLPPRRPGPSAPRPAAAAVRARARDAPPLPGDPLPPAAAVAAVPQAPDADHDPDLPAAQLRRLLR